ncbi:MAG: T9SS type A sorting domain-containing protein [Bacteroidales bacterium]|nr:T9SS type A sorting domain-containing protein [Bacteroidales bacterium]MCF8391528.1 T9SS type A sorting domain-containing protein [Bacteroidales bacterium]
MKKLRLLMLSGLLFLSGMSFAAEVTVPSGEDIQTYIDAAAEGDVILLESGGIYEGKLSLTKTITIKAVDGYTVRPIFNSTSTDGIVFEGVKNGREVIIQGIEFASDGTARYLLRFSTGDSLSYLEVSDVVAHGYDRSFLRASDAGTNIDSVLIDNVYCYNFSGSDYRLFYFDGNDCPVNYFKVVNSTFSGFDRTFLQLSSSVKKTIIVDNCNIHGRTDLRADYLFDINGAAGTTFTITNSIISSIKLGQIWKIGVDVEDNISNCSYVDIEVPADMLANTWTSETAFLEQDPMFSNGPAGVLYLDPSSPALTASTTGGPIGDPRWITAPAETTLFDISVDAGMLSPAFSPATLDYTCQLPFGTTTVNVDAIANFADATVTGTGAVDVSSGSGVSTILVTAADASTQSYSVTFTVTPASTDATLSSLVLSSETETFVLTPAFDPGTLNYTLLLPMGSDTVLVVATPNFSAATAEVTVSEIIDLAGTVTVVVTAEDGSTQTYSVALTVSTAPNPANITFIVDDSNMATATGFAIKGSWNTATGEYDAAWSGGAEHSNFFDDGTNGDVTAGDHIWTVTLALVPDGGANTWEWGVNDAAGNWIDGNFQFTVPDDTDQTLAAFVIVGLDPASAKNFSVYPNPASSILQISNAEQLSRVELINLAGQRIIQEINTGKSIVTISVEGLSSGVYVLRLTENNKAISYQKLIVE